MKDKRTVPVSFKKSIDSALEVLLNLSKTSKLVGVISHRDELAEAIPQKIVVTRSADHKGSEFKAEMGM